MIRRCLFALALLLLLPGLRAAPPPAKPPAPKPAAPPRPILMAHYMPWFAAKPVGKAWGWHWTMNHFDPERTVNGRQEAASYYRPLMGLYDSSDPDALDCQMLTMKFSGIDGILIDWYGTDDYWDYGVNHRNTLAAIQAAKKAKLRFAVVYEDQTVPNLIAGHVFPEAEAAAHGKALLAWVQTHWFSDPAYLAEGGRPVFLVFGSGYYTGAQWTQMLAGLPGPPLLVTESEPRPPAGGAFLWPQPAEGLEAGTARSVRESGRFYAAAPAWPFSLPAAWPRFDDVYAEAGQAQPRRRIADRDGQTYAETLARALRSGASVVQLVTWNDWGEGTQIEPSVEFGYRDLEETQRQRRLAGPAFPYTPADLRLPLALYARQKQAGSDPAARKRLDAVSRLLRSGHLAEARARLAEPPHPARPLLLR